jgi:alcohol dehydrogenase
MRAVLTTAHGGREMLQVERSAPDPQPGEGEVRIRVAATAINFHDIFTRRGMPGVRVALPVITGSDIAGTVEALGPGADARWRGARVLVDPVVRTGDRVGMLGETLPGGRAELVVAHESMLVRIPDGVRMEDAACLPLAYGTAYRMLLVRGALQRGERVLILGASGGVGVACVQLAKMIGAEVMAVASTPEKLQRLRALGADHVADYTERSFVDTVKAVYGKPRVTGGGGVQVAVNFTGGETMVPTQRCVALGGRILCCGATAGFNVSLDARYLWTFEHTIVGSDGWMKADLETLLDLIVQRKLAPVIDRTLPLEEAAEGERLLEDREVCGKVLLVP